MPAVSHEGWLPVRGRSGPGHGPPQSVNLHGSIYLADKHVGCIEANGAREQPEGQNHEGRVAKVQERGDELNDVQLGQRVGREKTDGCLVPGHCSQLIDRTVGSVVRVQEAWAEA